MFVKYRKATNQRLVFVGGAMLIMTDKTVIAIGRENKEYSNSTTIAFDVALVDEEDKPMIKRFVRMALNNEKDKRRLNYNFTKEKELNFTPTLAFS